jgi:hypothetical protein
MRTAFYEDPATEHEVWDDESKAEFPLLYSTAEPPSIRSRLHVICALYANAVTVEQRLTLLDHLEALAHEAAALMAVELLDGGWRPDVDLPTPPLRAVS